MSVPVLQDLVPDRTWPESQLWVHDEPLAKEPVQLPTPPFVGVADASHGFGEQVALVVSTRFKHDDVPETVYPVSHVG
jgi:hypothetical protein